MSLNLNYISTLNDKKFFELHGQDFHILSKLETKWNKTFKFIIHDRVYNFTKEEAYLLSPKCYHYILEYSHSFTILLSHKKKYQKVNLEYLIHNFEKLILIFSSLSQVYID
jgi:hypothetical protein